MQWRKTEGVHGAEDEDHSDGGCSSRFICLAALVEDAGSGRHGDPDNAATNHGEQEQRATTDALDERGTSQGEGELEAGVAEIDVGLLDGVLVACGLEDSGKEVGEHAVAGPLGEDGEDDVAGDAVDAGTLVEEDAVIPPALVLLRHVSMCSSSMLDVS